MKEIPKKKPAPEVKLSKEEVAARQAAIDFWFGKKGQKVKQQIIQDSGAYYGHS